MYNFLMLNLVVRKVIVWLYKVKPKLEQKEIAYKNKETKIQGGSNMTGTDLYVNKPHCAAAVRP